jgi:hypothetical protein
LSISPARLSGVIQIQAAFDTVDVYAETGNHGFIPEIVALHRGKQMPNSLELFVVVINLDRNVLIFSAGLALAGVILCLIIYFWG